MLLPVLFFETHRNFEATCSVVHFLFGKHGKANAAKLPIDVTPALVRSDTETDNRVCAMNCLLAIAINVPAYVLADSEAVT